MISELTGSSQRSPMQRTSEKWGRVERVLAQSPGPLYARDTYWYGRLSVRLPARLARLLRPLVGAADNTARVGAAPKKRNRASESPVSSTSGRAHPGLFRTRFQLGPPRARTICFVSYFHSLSRNFVISLRTHLLCVFALLLVLRTRRREATAFLGLIQSTGWLELGRSSFCMQCCRGALRFPWDR